MLTDFSDTDFDINQYPVVDNDYSLNVVQIAESTNKDLLVYVYQPCGELKNLRASSIRISTMVDDNAEWLDYSLTYVESEQTIYKYRVNGLRVKLDNERYYDISAISRQWDKSIDLSSGTDMTINEVSYRVGQLWTVSTLIDGSITYSMRVTDVVELTDLYANSIRYPAGHKFYGDKACDIFYVGFSSDHDIDKLKEADVDFTYYKYTYETGAVNVGPLKIPNSDVHKIAYLKADETTEYGSYSWKWIQSSSAFLDSEGKNLSSAAKEKIKKQQWVLLYFGCELSIVPVGPVARPTGYSYRGYTTESVSVLRLNFEYDGVTYNLGVVSDKVTPAVPLPPISEDPLDWFKAILQWLMDNWKWLVPVIIGGIIVIVLLIVFAPFLPVILSGLFSALKALGHCLLWLFKGLWWLISAPFRLIVHLISGGK